MRTSTFIALSLFPPPAEPVKRPECAATHWQTQENRPSGSAPHASPDGHVPPHVGWKLLMHGVEPAGTQPHVALRVVSSMRSVEHTAPAGHAPPQVAPANTEPPVSAQGVATAARHAHDCVGPALTSAQQVRPAAHAPPHPGYVALPHGVVVIGGVRAATIALASFRTCAAIASASPQCNPRYPRSGDRVKTLLHLPPRSSMFSIYRAKQRPAC
jgi:hypothetical protein